ncbi:MAG TPA: T9SS type A sorting domain-containing protein [Bacteroidia bacterium]|nr:T9SS type A sorting domain-containing protein [Bacteroidia bacterium]
MKKIITLSVAITFSWHVFPQIIFQKTIGGSNDDKAHAVRQTADGGYIVAGSTKSFGAGDEDIYLVKADSAGNVSWTKTFGTTAIERANDVEQTADGGYIIGGLTAVSIPGNWNFYIVKTDSSGNYLWSKSFGGTGSEDCRSIKQTTDGGYIMTGMESSNGPGAGDVFVVRTDSNGNLLWSNTYGEILPDEGYDIAQTTDGNYIIAGIAYSFTFSGYNSIYLLKINTSGYLLWSKVYYTPDIHNFAYSVCATADGGCIVAGETLDLSAGIERVLVIKTNANGIVQWSKTFGGADYEAGFGVWKTGDGGYIIGGATWSFGASSGDMYLIKTNATGNVTWSEILGGPSLDECFSVRPSKDGGYILAGISNNDISLIKTNANGISGCYDSTITSIVTNPSILFANVPTVTYSVAAIAVTPATQTGNGGSITTLCYSVGMDEASAEENTFSLFPNPATNQLTIAPDASRGELKIESIEIYNPLGEKVYSNAETSHSTAETINITALTSGIYFVRVKTSDGMMAGKFVKE